MVRTTLTASRPVLHHDGARSQVRMDRAGRYSTTCRVGVVIIGLSLGSFRQNARWVRLAKTPVGFVPPKQLLGSFRQNARWVRLAKTPAGASLDGQCDLQKVQKVQEVQEVQEDAWPTRRRQGEEGLSALPALSAASKAAHCSHGSNRMRCGRDRLAASASSSHDPKRRPLGEVDCSSFPRSPWRGPARRARCWRSSPRPFALPRRRPG